jgi:hypothetical protein
MNKYKIGKTYKKTIPLNTKKLGTKIKDYPFVEISWLDNKEKLPVCVSKGYLVSQLKGVTRIFTDYIKAKEGDTFENIGNTTIIPTSVIQSIKILH